MSPRSGPWDVLAGVELHDQPGQLGTITPYDWQQMAHPFAHGDDPRRCQLCHRGGAHRRHQEYRRAREVQDMIVTVATVTLAAVRDGATADAAIAAAGRGFSDAVRKAVRP